jgi:hypothetical protein
LAFMTSFLQVAVRLIPYSLPAETKPKRESARGGEVAACDE